MVAFLGLIGNVHILLILGFHSLAPTSLSTLRKFFQGVGLKRYGWIFVMPLYHLPSQISNEEGVVLQNHLGIPHVNIMGCWLQPPPYLSDTKKNTSFRYLLVS